MAGIYIYIFTVVKEQAKVIANLQVIWLVCLNECVPYMIPDWLKGYYCTGKYRENGENMLTARKISLNSTQGCKNE